jgi:hypothetical protein
MSTQTQHDPKNDTEISYWNSAGGRHWVERQQSQDIVLGPILQETLDARSCGRASVLSTSDVVPARVRSSSPSAGQVLSVDVSAPMLARAADGRPGQIRTRRRDDLSI